MENLTTHDHSSGHHPAVSKRDCEALKQELAERQHESRRVLQQEISNLKKHFNILPVEFTMSNFKQHKQYENVWKSEPFYIYLSQKFGPLNNGPSPPPSGHYISKYLDPRNVYFRNYRYSEIDGPPLKFLVPLRLYIAKDMALILSEMDPLALKQQKLNVVNSDSLDTLNFPIGSGPTQERHCVRPAWIS